LAGAGCAIRLLEALIRSTEAHAKADAFTIACGVHRQFINKSLSVSGYRHHPTSCGGLSEDRVHAGSELDACVIG
jgi:hypothetical protein